jgi:PAS domain S-box-containing protein
MITLNQRYDNTLFEDFFTLWNKIRNSDPDLLQNVIDSIPLPIFFTSSEFVFTGTNKTFDTIISGKEQKYVLGESFDSIQPELFATKWLTNTIRLLQNPETTTFQTPLLFSDGEVHQTSISISIFTEIDNGIAIIGIINDVTSRNDIELTLRATEQRFRKLFEESNDAILIHDDTGAIFDVNHRAVTLSGYSKSELLSLNVKTLYSETSNSSINYNRDSYRDQKILKRKNGQPLFCDISARPFDKNGKLIQSIIRDISAFKKAEQALSESEKKYRELYNSMNEGVALHKLIYSETGEPVDYEIIDANPAFETMLNITKSEAIGKLSKDVYSTVTPPYLESYSEVVESGNALTFDSHFKPLDKHFKINVFSPAPDQFATVFSDITASVKFQLELKKSEEEFRAIFNSVSDSIFILDMDGKILKVNKTACKLFGYKENNFLKINFSALLLSSSSFDINDKITLLNQLEVITFEVKHITLEGKVFPSEVTLKKIFLGDKQSLLVISHDLTEQKKVETTLRNEKEKVEKLNNKLEETITEAKQMIKNYESANMVKNNFLSIITHELQTPLNGIISSLDLLNRSTDNRNHQEYFSILYKSADALSFLLEEIGNFSKIEDKQIQIHTGKVDIIELIETTCCEHFQKAWEKGLTCKILIDSDLPTFIYADGPRLSQILTHILHNAIKFTDEDIISVSITSEYQSESKVLLRFEIADSGIGIHTGKDILLDNSSVRIDSSSIKRYGGAGLGLTISKHFAELMNGSLSYKNNSNKGTTFEFKAIFDICKKESNSKVLFTEVVHICIFDNLLPNSLILGKFCEQISDYLKVSYRFSFDELMEDPKCYRYIFIKESLLKPAQLEMYTNKFPNTHIIRLVPGTYVQKADCEFSSLYLTKPYKRKALFELFDLVQSNNFNKLYPDQVFSHYRRHALIVDDNNINQKVAKTICYYLGCTCDIVYNGLEATKILKTTHYDFVLLDLQMPYLDGFEVLKNIRDLSSPVIDHNVPVIAMTAHSSVEDQLKCFDAGMNGFLSKPFTAADLKPILDTIFKISKNNSQT